MKKIQEKDNRYREMEKKRVPVRKIEGSHNIGREERDTLFGLHGIR